jgi:hypothetical protein
MSDLDLDALRAELDDFAQPAKKGGRSAREERIVAGFEDIQRFTETHGRGPQHGEDRDIFERLYAVRLDRLRQLEDCRSLLEPFDHQGLLSGGEIAGAGAAEALDDDALLAELGDFAGASGITELRHVRPSAEKRAAEEIASREKCGDFATFEPLFRQVQRDLESGMRSARPFVREAGFLKAEIRPGQFFILGGQTAYVSAVGDPIKAPNGESDARLRVIYSNGTESDLLLRSLQRALYKDEAGRRITEPSAGPLFGHVAEPDDLESGTIYVLRSQSDHPYVAANRELIHKIGVTGGAVATRISHAPKDATYLLAGVEVVATYRLFNVNRAKLEGLLHRVFAPARLELTIADRFGQPVQPREWYLAPLAAIDEAIGRVEDGSIADYEYDPRMASFVRIPPGS